MSLTPNHHSLTERIGWPSARQNLSTSRSLCSRFTVSQMASFGLTAALFLGVSNPGAIAQSLPEQQVAQVPQGAKVMATTNFLFVNPLLGNNATGTGSERTPFRTITHALQVAKPNTIILLAPGTYNTQSGEVFPLRLKPGVTVQGDSRVRGKDVLIQGGGPFLSPTAAAQNITILAADQAGLAGVTVTNYNPRGYGLWIESANPIILDSNFTDNTHDGISVAGNSAPVIRGNYFYRNGASGISVFGSSRPEIRENTFEQTGFGINVADNGVPLIVSNQIRSNEDGIVIQGNAQPIVRGNLIENNRRDGLVAIAQARPDLGTELEPGGNVFRDNSRFDVNTDASTQIIPAFGNQLGSRTNGRIDLIGRAKQVEPSPVAAVEVVPIAAKPQSIVGPTTAIATPAPVTATSSPNQPTQTVIQPRITREVVPVVPTISVISANASAPPANPAPAATPVPRTQPTVSVAPTPTTLPVQVQSAPTQPIQTQPIPIQVPQPEVTAQPTSTRDRASTPPTTTPSTPSANTARPPVVRVTPSTPISTAGAPSTAASSPRTTPTPTEKPPTAIAPAKPVESEPAKPEATEVSRTAAPVPPSRPAQVRPTPRPTPPTTQPEVSAASFPVPASLGTNTNTQSNSSLNIARAFEQRSQPTQTLSIQSVPVTPPPSQPTAAATRTPPPSRPSARATEPSRSTPTVRATDQPKPAPIVKPIEQPKPAPVAETAIEIPVPPPEVTIAPVTASPPQRDLPPVSRSRRTQPPAIAVAPTPAPATSIEISVPPPENSEVARTSSSPVQPAIAPLTTEPPTSEIAAVSNPDILPVPGLEIPVGNGGGELPAVIVPRNPLDRSVNSQRIPVTATSSSGSSNLGRYRVVVEVADEGQQDQVRSLIPNAFRTVSNGRVVMQVGSFSDRANADKMTEMLSGEGLKAVVEQI